ncbi:hypothetical protein MHYP_G00344280 [Metynnis hypsauchen]
MHKNEIRLALHPPPSPCYGKAASLLRSGLLKPEESRASPNMQKAHISCPPALLPVQSSLHWALGAVVLVQWRRAHLTNGSVMHIDSKAGGDEGPGAQPI